MKVWHISDTHLSFREDGTIKKPMESRRWSLGAWTYLGYLDKMKQFAADNICSEDIVIITGDICHDMKEKEVVWSLGWLRHNIKGTLVIIRGNHDIYWDVGRMRKITSCFIDFHLIDEGEILSLDKFMFGCFSNHKEKTIEFHNMATDGRYLEMAYNLVRQAKDKGKVPVMLSHYPVNPELASAIGKAGVVAYMSGHVHCTGVNEPGNIDGVSWFWYDKSAKLTDDLVIEGCFFSTGTTDVLLAKHGKSFKHISALDGPVAHQQLPAITADATVASEMIILVGLPGSGKSTIAKVLAGKEYTRVNQDELGSRKMCVKVAEAALKRGESVVIDRCNFDKSQRDTWINLAIKYKVPKIKAVMLHCHRDMALFRAMSRTDHPTIKDDATARLAVSRIADELILPDISEGFSEILDVPANYSIEQTLEILLGPAKPHGEG